MKNNTSLCETCKFQANEAWDYPCPTCNHGSNYVQTSMPIATTDLGVATSRPTKATPFKRRAILWVLSVALSLIVISAKIALMTLIIYVSDTTYFHNYDNDFIKLLMVSALLVLFVEHTNTEYEKARSYFSKLLK